MRLNFPHECMWKMHTNQLSFCLEQYDLTTFKHCTLHIFVGLQHCSRRYVIDYMGMVMQLLK